MSRSTKEKLPLILIPLGLLLLYLCTHLYNLVSLPVFADEAIYIRWTQLIIDDWKQYLFFPMNDGKTPLFIWMMVPFQYLFKDQLFAGRFLSVLVGLLQIGITVKIVKALGGRTKTQWLAAFFIIILPFWYFHHRMALMDSLLTFFLSCSVYGVIILGKIPQIKTKKLDLKKIFTRKDVLYIAVTGVSFGLALLTKLPAVLFLPVLPVFTFLPAKLTKRQYFILFAKISTGLLVGLGIFAAFKLHPAFGQLFSRGSDFLFTIPEILGGEWKQSFKNSFQFSKDVTFYLTWPIILFNFVGLFFAKTRRKIGILILASFAFLLPIMIMGRVVYPRYLLPVALFPTVGAALSIQAIIDSLITKQKNIIIEAIYILILVQLIAISILTSLNFMSYAMFNPDMIPFTAKDQMQFHHEWSSGHGISETVQYIQDASKDETIIVATEGYFGTLPDALLMYLHRTDVTNIFIEGIGQPVREIPDDFVEKSQEFDRAILVVNSHRMNLPISDDLLIEEYCRPDKAPCLQIWDITPVIKKSE